MRNDRSMAPEHKKPMQTKYSVVCDGLRMSAPNLCVLRLPHLRHYTLSTSGKNKDPAQLQA